MIFTNRYLELGEEFYQQTSPQPVAQPSLIIFNHELAKEFAGSLSTFDEHMLTQMFSGNQVHESSVPLAMAYAGHQFGHFNPQLGDGRAIYLGELTRLEGGSMDVQLKGSGRTRFSRGGDGRSALGPVLREYLLSEAMHKLGVPTTRALAAVSSGEQVWREQKIPGGVITRIASSFIRVGTFQYFAAQQDLDSLQKLADYVLECNYPEHSNGEDKYLALFKAVVTRQAQLIAKWMCLGFIHGVMNTDNMSIAGETIDYGPCAFMDYFRYDQVYSFIDKRGRYAYQEQPSIGLWNLTRLAEALLPLFNEDVDVAVEQATSILKGFAPHYDAAWLINMRSKLGLTASVNDAEDKSLVEGLLNTMAESEADFTLAFHHLSQMDASANEKDESFHGLFSNSEKIKDWLRQWRKRLELETQTDTERQAQMGAINPVYIPRNHQIEKVIRAAEDNNNFEPFHELHTVLENPFTYQQGKDTYMQPPKPGEVVVNTFCGT
ncbi:MAG: YdiU family protein [Gammaproteobacteria bacterium]|nr:YdiU family protein [Gammaproteobacteria bacterium]